MSGVTYIIIINSMEPAITLSIIACGLFFLTGLITGAWKYHDMTQSPDTETHYYINTAHRASLLYAFAALVLIQFVEVSPWSETTNLVAVAIPLFFFGFAITTYVIHGALKDTENQFHPPHRIGEIDIPPYLFQGATILLITGEIGGFLILFIGFLIYLL